MDHPYSHVPQVAGMRVHTAPYGSLSTVKDINTRNKRKAVTVEVTPRKEIRATIDPNTVARSEKKEKKDKKESKKGKK
jgi:hypothetical protein